MNFHPDISVQLFEKEDAFNITLRPEDEHVRNDPFFEPWAETNALGAGFTGVRKSDGKILGCGGIKVISPGVGEAWALFCDEIGLYAKECKEYAVHYLSALVKEMGLQRLQCVVYADEKIKVRYVKALGFEAEGTMRKFKDGRDCVMLAMTVDAQPPAWTKRAFALPAKADKRQELEKMMMTMPQTELTPIHHFAKGLYCRELFIPKGTLISGKVHKQEHIFILFSGEHVLCTDHGPVTVKGPYFKISPPGTKRLGYALTDCVGMNILATDLTDPEEIEDTLTCCGIEEYESQLLPGPTPPLEVT
jgi:RimJ/RimL family protein N-acetyltransferase